MKPTIALQGAASAADRSALGQSRDVTVMTGAGGVVQVTALPDGKRRISVEPKPGLTVARRSWDTSYPLVLVQAIHAIKGVYVCDEIMREEDPRYVEHCLRHEALGYLDAADFAGRRVLDFGCGAGASTMVLARLLPPCEIVGVELQQTLLWIARLRAEHFHRTGVRFLRSPAGDVFPEGLGLFDYILFSAVYEHLLPSERRMLLPLIWSHLAPGGVLFLNQTPHRYSPLEVHTTGLPLINYLSDGLALRTARRWSTRVNSDDDWEALLRAGIRGATVREVLRILAACGSPVLLEPKQNVGDQIDLWYGKLSRRHAWLKRSVWLALKALKATTGVVLTPELSLAIRKEA
jgi:2-polyprenyl-3-methyl-5-hydroxy-6-metoxy-1,4-benzoquinol methylase